MSTNVRHSTKTVEHYSPERLVEAARGALNGKIDLDPASCEFANLTIKAKTYFTAKTNGFLVPWRGNVFLNPPGGSCDKLGRMVIKRSGSSPPCTESGACGLPAPHGHVGVVSSQKAWWFKLVCEWTTRRVKSAVFLSFSIELLQTSQISEAGALTPHDFPICFPSTRIAYDREVNGVRKSGNSPPHSSMIVFLPDRADRKISISRFVLAFEPFGKIINA